MVFYMDSKVFESVFLKNERDQDILDTQYVLVSYKIKGKGLKENILDASNYLFPSAATCCTNSQEDFKDMYMDQLEHDGKAVLALILHDAIKYKQTVVFICTKKEKRLNYLKYIAEYVEETFHYPIYNYKEFSNWGKLKSVDEKATDEICIEVINEAKFNYFDTASASVGGRNRIKKELNKMSTKELRYRLSLSGIDAKSLSRKKMIKYALKVLQAPYDNENDW